ncbi:MAG: hypothetical protein K2M66_00350, partial [Alistipes sp.]|nr:hypothetical protein [Alistipes sp.]
MAIGFHSVVFSVDCNAVAALSVADAANDTRLNAPRIEQTKCFIVSRFVCTFSRHKINKKAVPFGTLPKKSGRTRPLYPVFINFAAISAHFRLNYYPTLI